MPDKPKSTVVTIGDKKYELFFSDTFGNDALFMMRETKTVKVPNRFNFGGLLSGPATLDRDIVKQYKCTASTIVNLVLELPQEEAADESLKGVRDVRPENDTGGDQDD